MSNPTPLDPPTGEHMTLPEFFDHVTVIQEDRRRRGVVTVYFMHDELTPSTVRGVWEEHPLSEVPNEGDLLNVEMGYMGALVCWRVARRQDMPGAAVTLHMTDADPSSVNDHEGVQA